MVGSGPSEPGELADHEECPLTALAASRRHLRCCVSRKVTVTTASVLDDLRPTGAIKSFVVQVDNPNGRQHREWNRSLGSGSHRNDSNTRPGIRLPVAHDQLDRV